MKVSIIIPIYNCEKYLRQCIDSILMQSYKDIEVILIDDGSTDNCPEICDEYSVINNQIKVVHSKNYGVSHTRNIGIELSLGEYVVFVDGDDYLDADMIKSQCTKMDENNADLVVCGYTIISEDNIFSRKCTNIILKTKRDLYNFVLKYYKKGLINPVWNKMYKREYLIKHSFNEDLSLGEDLIFNLEYLKSCNKVICYNRCLYYYRINHNITSLSRCYRNNLYEICEYMHRSLVDFLICKSDYNANVSPINGYFFKKAIGYLFKSLYKHKHNNIIKYKLINEFCENPWLRTTMQNMNNIPKTYYIIRILITYRLIFVINIISNLWPIYKRFQKIME